MAGAQSLASGLSMVRPNVTLVQEHSTGRDLAGAAAHLGEGFEMVFPSGKRMRDLETLVEWSRHRYDHVSKLVIDRAYESAEQDRWIDIPS